ncbi:hypothetical protein MesoLj113c_60520 [Mesorhizobium sp. 113-3-9]|nr:hypothetical protein MesoLj113c_60520 [Mesorhizobium sp. 113-3-9]
MLASAIGLDVDKHDIGAIGMKALGAGKAQSLSCPGNDRDFSCVLHGDSFFDEYGYVIQSISGFCVIASPWLEGLNRQGE